MSLYKKILLDWSVAMKARNREASLALSNIKAALLSRAVDDGVRGVEPDDNVVLSVLRKMQKQSTDTISSLPAESILKEKEERELSIISSYLPAKLSDEELSRAVNYLLSSLNIKDFSAGMKECMASFRSVADGKQIQSLVRKFLEERGDG